MRTRTTILAFALMMAMGRPATAQVERYELGQRLKRFEADWENADEASRKRALKVLKPVTRQYLTFQLAEAGRTLDEARFALRSKKPTDAERWLASLAIRPTDRLIDASVKTIRVEVRPFYSAGVEVPKAASVRTQIGYVAGGGGLPKPPFETPIRGLPATLDIALPTMREDQPEDLILGFGFDADGKETAHRMAIVCRVSRLTERLAALRKAAKTSGTTVETATLVDRVALFDQLTRREDPETDLPLAELFTEAEALRANEATPAMTGLSTSFRVTVPAAGKATPCRLSVPFRPDPKKPLPVVVALHGMGGSENLYFEGYGAGCVVKACEKRGWMLVCPRGGLGFVGGPPPVSEIIDKLAERYPIDKSRVFLMGHSMGAAQAVDLAQQQAGKFAAVAVLGGGGRVRKPEAFADLPTFIGIGSEDFAKSGATGLHKTLTDAGAKAVTFREYPDVEHTVIVRAAVDDVFASFDKVAGRP
jgi:predicted esterase